MQGLYNDAIIHPEALVISDELLTDYVPFVKINDVTVTPFGEISLLWIIEPLKFFIGTNNMIVINKILKALKYREGIEIDLSSIPNRWQKDLRTSFKWRHRCWVLCWRC